MEEQSILLKIGELSGTVSSLLSRIDNMHSDNGIKFNELISQISDIKAQAHEIKHSQNDAAQKVVILEQKTNAFRDSTKSQHESLLKITQDLKEEVLANRNANIIKFEELFELKNKLFGFTFLILFIISIIGKQIFDLVSGSFHFFTK